MRGLLIVVGLALLGLGIAWPWLDRIGPDRLPGDITMRRLGFTLYVPLGSAVSVSIEVSLALTLLAWLFRR